MEEECGKSEMVDHSEVGLIITTGGQGRFLLLP